MRRDYTAIGEREGYTKEAIDSGILTAQDWQDISVDKSVAFSQGYAITEAIKQFRIPKVTHVSQFGMIDGHSLLGIRAKYKNGLAEIYIADNGLDAIPVAIDFEQN